MHGLFLRKTAPAYPMKLPLLLRLRTVLGKASWKAARATARLRPFVNHIQLGVRRHVSITGWDSRGILYRRFVPRAIPSLNN